MKADSRQVEGAGTLVFCGKSIGSYASQLALSCEARLWHHKTGFKREKKKVSLAKLRKDRMKNMLLNWRKTSKH